VRLDLIEHVQQNPPENYRGVHIRYTLATKPFTGRLIILPGQGKQNFLFPVLNGSNDIGILQTTEHEAKVPLRGCHTKGKLTFLPLFTVEKMSVPTSEEVEIGLKCTGIG
jgi:hypothetical protein